MSVEIRKMTSDEFEAFYKWSVEHHVRELTEELQMSESEAIGETINELSGMLPDGLKTENNNFMTIVSENENVGFIWTVFEETEGKKQCFICDFAVWESNRRKGYGEKALYLAERSAANAGAQESVLFVRDENEAARALYEKCGYRILRQEGYGKYMSKQLRLQNRKEKNE